jgi:hypothetical protein
MFFASPAVIAAVLLASFAAALAPPAATAPVAAPIRWHDDYGRARAEATAARKPLLVVFRCQNRPEAAGLDTRDGRALDPELAALISKRYIPVRINNIKGINLADFRFDYDLQFAVLVMDGHDETTLARWGTRDAKSPTGRLSLAGLKHTLRLAADAYVRRRSFPGRRTRKLVLLEDYPVFARSRRASEPCYHCHYAYDAQLAGDWTGVVSKAVLFRYPLPESVGITLDMARNNRVAAVRPGSPAAKAGVRTGDVIIQAEQTPVYSSADLQFALDQDATADPSSIPLTLERGGKLLPRPVTLSLPHGWSEREDISWRASQGGVPPFLGTWETALSAKEKAAIGVPADRMALRITHLFSGEKWEKTRAGLEVGDVIVACDGEAPPAMDARRFHTWYRLRYAVGQTARLTVVRAGKRVTVAVPCVDVDWQ